MENRGSVGKRERGGHFAGSQFHLRDFLFFFFFNYLPFGQFRLKLFHPMAEIERRHDTSNNTVEFSYNLYKR